MKYLDFPRYEKWLIDHSSYKDSRPCDRIDYSYKATILNTDGLCNIVARNNYELYLATYGYPIDFDTGVVIDLNTLSKSIDDTIDRVGVCAYIEASRINNAKYHRQCRLSNRIANIITNHSYFLTFTFENKYVYIPSKSYMTPKMMRNVVQRYLRDNFYDYVANVDYGAKNGRIHFHAVASAYFIDPNTWPYGNLDYEVIYTNNDPKLLTKYIDKLTNHAIKETTRRNHLIYHRKNVFRKPIDLGYRSMLYFNKELPIINVVLSS